MKLKIIGKFFCLIIFFTLSSCGLRTKMVYMQDDIKAESIKTYYTPVIKPNDLITITISSINQESVQVFNLPNINLQTNVGYTVGSPAPNSYLVDQNGQINLPVIGKVDVSNKTRDEIVLILESKVKDYVDSPIINVRIVNFKITVLGEVAKPGTYTIPNEKISVLEALGLAGDLTIFGKRENVMLIREENGIKVKHLIDLTSSTFLTSDLFYLQQNDVLYVEPNRIKVNSSAINTSNAGLIISAVSLIVTTMVLITK
jgi:polysaccharide biosynthesis/export protein